MTTNSKEYMREYQRQRRAKLKFIKEDVKKSVKNVKKYVKISELNPPKVETSVATSGELGGISEKIPHDSLTDSRTFMGIDFNRIANLSTFQRFIIEAIKITIPGFKGVPSRGKKEIMAKEFNSRVNDYRNVINELNEVLKKRRENEK